MSDKKTQLSSESGEPQDVPLVTHKAEPKSNFAKAKQTSGDSAAPDKKTASKVSRKRAGKRSKTWLWFLLVLCALCAAAVWGWYNMPQFRSLLSQQLHNLPGLGVSDSARETASSSQITGSSSAKSSDPASAAPPDNLAQVAPQTAPAQPSVSVAEATPSPVSDHSAALRRQLQQQNQTIQQLQQQLAELQRNVTSQGNRLSELGNASREDWQLAEADYLLRLANQRLLLEHDSRAALILVQEVDEIVRGVNLPDLYGVRQQLARDLTALKLAENVDREGLYLRLRALEEQMAQLNIQPQFDLATRDAATLSAVESDEKATLRSSWDNFLNFLQNSVRIRDGEIDPVLLSPQSETRFRQSLRLNMEQAELALLRADSTVYKDALNHARQLLLDYGTDNHQQQVILRELEELRGQTVNSNLPSLSASQSALQNYIKRLHKVAPVTEPDGNSVESNFPGGDSR